MEDIDNNENEYINNLKKVAEFCKGIGLKNTINDNIVLKYINDPNIINETSNLILLIKEIKEQIKIRNNILLPFLDILPKLIKLYIEKDIDESETLEYIDIFKLLKYNCFVSRECLYPIYEYFSHLFYDIEGENIQNIVKFNKVFKLWKIFYKFYYKENKNYNISPSSICFIGGSLKVYLPEGASLANSIMIIKINFLNILPNNDELILFKIEGEESYSIKFLLLKTHIKRDDIKTISLIIMEKEILISGDCIDTSSTFSMKLNHELTKLKEFYLLENFFGQIMSLDIKNIKKGKNNKIEDSLIINDEINNDKINFIDIIFHEIFEPYPLSDDGVLYHKSGINDNKKEPKYIINQDKDSNILINISDNKLIKVNYINYLDKNFNLIEYFGGFTPFIPFIELINKINKNSKINEINRIDKATYLYKVFDDILFLLLMIINNNSSQNSKIIQKYFLFGMTLIFQINYEIFEKKKERNDEKIKKIIEFIQSFEGRYITIIMFFFGKLINYSKNIFDQSIQQGSDLLKNKINEEFMKEKNPILIRTSFSQLYQSLMKELFIYNRYWSIKEFFFGNKKDNSNNNKTNLKLKYKQLSFYTKNYQQPLLYPILELEKFFPKFSRFKMEDIFSHDFNKCINYNFIFEDKDNIILEIIKKNNPLYKEKNKIECCLVKKNYHVKGEMFILKREENSSDFEIIFSSDSNNDNDNDRKACNKTTKNKNNNAINSNNDEICYGSVFPTPQREFNRKILIKSKDIKFILIRNYYRRTSAIEIFTYKSNKSYYFNFKEFIDVNNSKNLLLNTVKENENFKNITYHKIITLYYNKKYISTMFPLCFSERLDPKKIIKFYNNYDLLTIINLLSNRSFRDLYQYPIFPILYKPNNILDNEKNQERDLGQHIGYQELNEKNKERKELIEETYNASLQDGTIMIGNVGESKPHLFGTHYSNIVYSCNYLIRIFPYSLIGVELQGDGFDSPNRLFYSIQKTMINTLAQKSDLREMIPELYYFPDIFTNINDLCFGKLADGKDISNVSIKENKDNEDEDPYEKYEYLAKCKDYLEFSNLKLNEWINLIFGINQSSTVPQKKGEEKRIYYRNELDICFKYEDQKKYMNDIIIMQEYEFGIQPIQIFNDKFPDLKDKYKDSSKLYENIKQYNMNQFKQQHLIIKGDKEKCFICEGYNNIYPDYVKLISLDYEKYFKKKDDSIIYFHYLFVGDVFGNIFIYKRINNKGNKSKKAKEKFTKNKKAKEKNQNLIETNKKVDKVDNIDKKQKLPEKISPKKERNEVNNTNKEMKEIEYKEIKKITDHYKQIKYIDYNNRLNLFLSYSLDGFINIYTFPKCKLVRAIKVSDNTNLKEILEKVVLVSNPFPMIFCYDKKNMYLFTLNGDLIKTKPIEYNNYEIHPIIDKNCGIINDLIKIEIKDQSGKIQTKEILLPSLSEKIIDH